MVLIGLFIICACLFLGYLLATLTGIPIPAPVLGMALLLVVLIVWRPRREGAIMRGSDVLLTKMSLFFVPAGVGVMAHVAELRGAPVAVVVGMFLPWAVALVVGGLSGAATLKIIELLAGRRRSAPATAAAEEPDQTHLPAPPPAGSPARIGGPRGSEDP